MGARGTILPVAKGRSANGVGRATQARHGAGIEVGVPHAVARRARAVTEVIEVCRTNGLLRSAKAIEVVEGRCADVGAGARLREGHAGDQDK